MSQIAPASIHPSPVPPVQNVDEQYDYIVCGAGSSGSVVAGELAANPDVTVLLLEAGGTDDLEAVLDPNKWLSTLGSELDWGFSAEPNMHLNGRAIPYSMGKALGGGGSINVGIWARGHRADWDFFADAAGDRAWSSESILDIYRRVERRMSIQRAQNPHPFFSAALESMNAHGIRRLDETDGPLWTESNGCAYVDEIVHDGRRQSPFRSYVHPRMHQPNLTVLTEATLRRVTFDGRRAVGVEFTRDGKRVRAGAAVEIVLSLGALQTPKILMQSGIGDEAKLRQFSIPVIQHLPGVGRHLQDHVAIGCVFEAGGDDLPSAPRGQAVGFWKTDPAMSVPNALAFAIPIVYMTPENSKDFAAPAAGWSFFAGLATDARGELSLTGSDPSHPLRIETNFMSEPQDIKRALQVVAMCRSIGHGAALQPYTKQEAVPGNLSRAEMAQFVRNGIGTFWHQSGTARMGRDELSVVDGQLRVYGVDGLRIADASILPRVTAGNTMAPCVVIGQRAADLLRARYEQHNERNDADQPVYRAAMFSVMSD